MLLHKVFVVLAYFFLSADGLESDCVDGVYTDVSSFTFKGSTPEDYYGNVCTNMLGVRSIWAAAKLYCTRDEIAAGEKLLGGYCTEYGFVTLVPYDKVLPDLTDEFINSLQVVNYEDVDLTKTWNHSVLISRELFDQGYRTTTVFTKQYEENKTYGWSVYGFWGGILLIGIINRFVSHLIHSRRVKTFTDSEDASATPRSTNKSSGLLQSTHRWFQANLVLPAAFGSHHQRLLWGCTIPTRLETIVVLAFWAMNIVLCCVTYEIFWPNLYYTRINQKWRYIADRTGALSYANLAVIWMFSGRNNIFLWLTGWNFGTFNIFHRHVARIATIQAIVHSIAYTAMELNEGALAESWAENYWYMGGLATITMSLMLLFSSILLRKYCYEVFLLIHIVFSVLTIVGLFYHTAIFDGEWDPYLWPLVAIWLFDRVARLVRQAYCNLHVKLGESIVTTKTAVTYNVEADLIRLHVTPGSRILKPTPGQHYFLYQPIKWKGWENHPFTMAAWTNHQDDMQRQEVNRVFAHPSKALGKDIQADSAQSPSDGSYATDSSDEASVARSPNENNAVKNSQTTLTFLIRPHSSWTKRLMNECSKSPTGVVNAKFLIEGPYSERCPLHTFDKVVFIVGGTGISGALPYLQEHLERVGADSTKGTRTRDITLVWATKQSAMIHDVAARELRALLGRDDFTTDFHVTSKTSGAAAQVRHDADKLHESNSAINLSYGRPDVTATIRSAVNEAHATDSAAADKIAILTCGPAGMADEARVAVQAALKEGRQQVQYFEETFGW